MEEVLIPPTLRLLWNIGVIVLSVVNIYRIRKIPFSPVVVRAIIVVIMGAGLYAMINSSVYFYNRTYGTFQAFGIHSGDLHSLGDGIAAIAMLGLNLVLLDVKGVNILYGKRPDKQ